MKTENFLKDIVIEEPYKKLYHLKFPNQYALTSTFLRLQEFYESDFDDIKGNYFDLEYYMNRYAEQFGNFTYTIDWNGFNIPGDIVRRFFSVFEENLLQKEEELKKLLIRYIDPDSFDKTGDFYIIGTHKEEMVDHEISHGFFHLNCNYKNTMIELCDENTEYKKLWFKTLKALGYCNEVLYDEMQAYHATSDNHYLKKRFLEIEIDKRLQVLFMSTFTFYKEDLKNI